MLPLILGALKFLVSGLVAPVMGYLTKRSDNAVLTNGQNVTGDVAVAQAQFAARVEERKLAAAERAGLNDHWFTAWMIPDAFAACMLHFWAIVLDSTFHLNWQVAKLPSPYDKMEWAIVMTVIAAVGIPAVYQRTFGK